MIPDANAWQEIASWALKMLVLPLAVAIIKGRDMVLENRRRVVELSKKTDELQVQRDKDLIEQKSLIGLATSIDTKIDAKMKDFMLQANELRHKDSQVFTQAIHEMDKTLSKINQTLELMNKDVDSLKRNPH